MARVGLAHIYGSGATAPRLILLNVLQLTSVLRTLSRGTAAGRQRSPNVRSHPLRATGSLPKASAFTRPLLVSADLPLALPLSPVASAKQTSSPLAHLHTICECE